MLSPVHITLSAADSDRCWPTAGPSTELAEGGSCRREVLLSSFCSRPRKSPSKISEAWGENTCGDTSREWLPVGNWTLMFTLIRCWSRKLNHNVGKWHQFDSHLEYLKEKGICYDWRQVNLLNSVCHKPLGTYYVPGLSKKDNKIENIISFFQ